MPAVPVSLMTPLWAQFAALLPVHPDIAPAHPLGCHRRRIPDQVVFAHVIAALVFGVGYERIASPGCSARTIRRRVHAWADAGCVGVLPAAGGPVAGSVGARWVVEGTHSWLNDFGRLRRCPERCAAMVELHRFLAATIIFIRMLLRAAVQTFRSLTRTTISRLR